MFIKQKYSVYFLYVGQTLDLGDKDMEIRNYLIEVLVCA